MLLRALALASLILLPSLAEAAATNPSGLPLPRFVTVKAKESNVRVGPGYQYDIAWQYLVAGVPVEIIQEFDVWRKIRDVDGSTGWVHQNMLSGNRAGYVTRQAGDKVGLHAHASEESGIIAWVGPGFPVKINSCEQGCAACSSTSRISSSRASTTPPTSATT